MSKHPKITYCVCAGAPLIALVLLCCAWASEPVKLVPGKMAPIGTIDERFQSYNVEMVEVTGGRFWAPYQSALDHAKEKNAAGSVPQGIDARAYRYRPPVDLTNARLRRLAAGLGPAYMRVSGTWANSTYFDDSNDTPPATAPKGFGGVLTRQEWKGVVEFSRVVDANLITSFPVSAGVRDAAGVWTPGQARKMVAFTKSLGGSIAAAEFFNEPNLAAMGGAPPGYDASACGRDFAVFFAFAKQTVPDMLILGPDSLGEGGMIATFPGLKSQDLLAASGGHLDAFSYHFYGAVSKRCAVMSDVPQITPESALSDEWLSRTDRDAVYYAALRDRFAPGKPLWLTETAEAACGGDPWASTFLDTFRYLDQLGRLAKRGLQVVVHNTLDASDYGLIDEQTLTPRPNYWAALLWRRLMGTTVLEPGTHPAAVHLYAHCLRRHPGGVALLAVNTDRQTEHGMDLGAPAERYTLSSKDLLSTSVLLNGDELKLDTDGSLPALNGSRVATGGIDLPPASITFLAIPTAGNASCR